MSAAGLLLSTLMPLLLPPPFFHRDFAYNQSASVGKTPPFFHHDFAYNQSAPVGQISFSLLFFQCSIEG